MSSHADTVRQRFDTEAEGWHTHYEDAPRSIYTANLLNRRDAALSLANGLRGRILEVGCGAGDVILSVDDRPRMQVLGLDFSMEMLRRAKKRTNEVRRQLAWVNGDADVLPFREASFDAILCLGVLDYIPIHLPLLRECHRVLHPGGQIVLSVPNVRSPFIRVDDLVFAVKNALTRSLPAGLRGWLKRTILDRADASHYAYRKHRYDPDTFARDLAQVGFKVSTQVYRTYGFATLDRCEANRRLGQYLAERSTHSRLVERTGWTHILKATRLPHHAS